MKIKVYFLNYENYWVAEAENGAISQGRILAECRENIKDAIVLLDESIEDSKTTVIEEFDEVIEVAVCNK